ncbi:MAG TPA: phage tail tube protein [Chloroflexota bacterium]|jgi:hypothetical protein
MYWTEPVLTAEREPRPHRFATTTRDNVRGFTQGPLMTAGSFSFPMSADEIIEPLLMGIQGAVTPSGAGTAKTWVFKASGATVDSATIEYHDGANIWQGAGYYVDQITIDGSANGECTVSCDLFGMDLDTGTLTPALAERTPRFSEGWETKAYLDPFGTSPPTSAMALTVTNWNIQMRNQLDRKFFADNVNATGGITIGELEIEATITLEAASALALAAYNDWKTGVKQQLMLEFGNNELIGAGPEKYVVRVELPGAWSTMDLSGTDANTRVYSAGYSYVYSPVLAAGLQITAINGRTAAFA